MFKISQILVLNKTLLKNPKILVPTKTLQKGKSFTH